MRTAKVVDLFLGAREARGLSKETIRWYRGILKRFSEKYYYLPKEPEFIEEFLSEVEAGDERVHGYYRALRALYTFAQKRRNLINPIELMDPPIRKKKQPHILMPDEIDQLLSYPHPARIKAALLFLIDTGCRVGEVINLLPSDFKETPWGVVARVSGKTGERFVPVSYNTYAAMMNILPFCIQKHRLGELISRAFKEARVKGTAHSLRHTFATLWEGDVFALQRIMGHARISTTQMYRHLQLEMLIKQHQQYSPLKMVYSRSRSML